MVIKLEDQLAVTPGGKLFAVPIPVAPVVVWYIGFKLVFTSNVGLLVAEPAEFKGSMVRFKDTRLSQLFEELTIVE